MFTVWFGYVGGVAVTGQKKELSMMTPTSSVRGRSGLFLTFVTVMFRILIKHLLLYLTRLDMAPVQYLHRRREFFFPTRDCNTSHITKPNREHGDKDPKEKERRNYIYIYMFVVSARHT